MGKKGVFKKIADNLIYAEGNHGADFISICKVDDKDGVVDLRCGSCCVMTIDAEVPVEFLTGLITSKMIEFNNDIEAVIDSFGWDEVYKEELKKKVKNKAWRRGR